MEQISTLACNVYTIRSPGRDAWTLCSSDSVRAADSECANVQKSLETKLRMKKKGTLFKSLSNRWELIVFSSFNNGGGDNCVPPHRCVKMKKSLERDEKCFQVAWAVHRGGETFGNVLILIMNFMLALVFHPLCRCGWHLDLSVQVEVNTLSSHLAVWAPTQSILQQSQHAGRGDGLLTSVSGSLPEVYSVYRRSGAES